MKPLFIIAVIAGILLLSGIPCFADSGSGVSIELETTVVGGSSGWHDWSTYSGGYHTPYVSPNVAGNPPSLEPTYLPPPTYILPPNEPLPQVTPAVGVPMPTNNSSVNWGAALFIGSAILVVGLVVWYLWAKRQKIKEVEPSQPI